MQTKHLELWQKIKAFQLDETDVALPFSKKLAKENNWPIPFATQAIQEYKKFIFLSCINPAGASPSIIVDKVWHLHLTYTTSYWEDFCKKTLGKDIHHYPSKGGANENIKHKNWYAETLALYEDEFGEKPPITIWPTSKTETNNVTNNISYNKNIDITTSAICFIIILSAFIFSILCFYRINPYELRGQAFLSFFAWLEIAVLISTILILNERRKKILPYLNAIFPANYNLFQAVHFYMEKVEQYKQH